MKQPVSQLRVDRLTQNSCGRIGARENVRSQAVNSCPGRSCICYSLLVSVYSVSLVRYFRVLSRGAS